MAPPGEIRDRVSGLVAVAGRLELSRLGHSPTSEERVDAIERALRRRVHRVGTSADYRAAGFLREALRLFADAVSSALAAGPDPLDAPHPAPKGRLENEANKRI